MSRVTSILLATSAVIVVTASILVLSDTGTKEPLSSDTVVTGSTVSNPSADMVETAVGYTPMPEGATYVRVWDLGKKYTYKHYWPIEQWADRANWTQVPYGQEENYEFQGDCMLEGPNFWVSLHSSPYDACFLYNKVDQEGTPSRHNEMYRSYDGPGGLRTYCSGYEYNKIIKNELGDIIVESATRVRYRDGYPNFPVQIINRYRVQAGKPWLEIEPIAMASEQGMHGESRIHISPDSLPGGQDFLADSWKNPPDQSVYHPTDTSRMLLDLIMDDDCIWAMMWKTVGKIPGINHPFYYTRSRSDNTSGGYPAGWQRIGEGTSPVIFTAPFVKYRDEKMIIGVLRIGYWHYQKINAAVQAGQDYQGQFHYAYQRQVTSSPFSPGGRWWPMYPGKWRMIGRVNGQYYTRQITVTSEDVGKSAFTFNSPVTGNLEYIVFYLYDRTDQTPWNVYTLMDIYRSGVLEMNRVIVGRHVFYNNSAFDGYNAAANADDDNAIAIDKTALLPGGTATFANYTSYSRGINGIMVDIANLPGTPTKSDFVFKAGNDSLPPGLWADASAPSSVTVRKGAGTGGSDRITIIWTDNAIQKQWLQVTVKATAATGLFAPDVFYFGNAIGETGNSTTDAMVKPTDEIGARNNPHTLGGNPAGIEDAYDFNRDGKVGPTDEIIARSNGTNSSTALKLITVP